MKFDLRNAQIRCLTFGSHFYFIVIRNNNKIDMYHAEKRSSLIKIHCYVL